MRYESYSKAERSCRRNPRPFYRIDVVLFNLSPDEYGNDVCIDGEYCIMKGGFHPFECFFDDKDEAVAYIEGFTKDMAQEALILSDNELDFDHVAVEVNELDGMDPGMVVASREWLFGCQLQYWYDDDCCGRLQ